MHFKLAAKKRIEKAKEKLKKEEFINKLKNKIKKEDAYIEICKKYNAGINRIDDVQVSFDDDLDVSAKTVNGEVFLNNKLYEDGDLINNIRYLIHEFCHVLQQHCNLVHEQTNKDEYLQDPLEQEAFSYQAEYMNDHMPEEEVQEYLEHLVDYHDVKGKTRRNVLKELTKKI